MAEGRSVWRLLLQNIRNSLKILPPKGRLVGKDQLGNEYFEAPKNVHSRRKSAIRWFTPEKEDDWQQDLPAEWEAWLRGRRKHPPTEEEVMHNLSIANMKKIKGAEIENKNKKVQDTPTSETTQTGFPKLKDYETEAGKFLDKKNKYE